MEAAAPAVLPGEEMLPLDAPGAEDPLPPAVEQAPDAGVSAWGLIEIPALGLRAAVVEGTGRAELARGPGWLTSSALPGEGNTVVAGHRTMYGHPFHELVRIEVGDEVHLTYRSVTYSYRVERIFPVEDTDWSVTRPCGYPALTLLTCSPRWFGGDRVVVRARLLRPAPGAAAGLSSDW